jgi:hypothetical protein
MMRDALREGVRLVGEGLRDHPLALALVIINLCFLPEDQLILRIGSVQVKRCDERNRLSTGGRQHRGHSLDHGRLVVLLEIIA